jgi:zinc-ribbon family
VLLLWGWRSLLTVLGVGEFHCPRCQADRNYQLVRPRRWFTLFFIPVIPLKWGETFVQCSVCKAGFNEGILSTPTNRQFSYMIALGARAMYAKALAAGLEHSEAMIDQAVTRVVPFVDDSYNEANLIADVEAFKGHALLEYLGPLAPSMELNGRESLISGLVAFAYTGGEPSAALGEVVSDAAAALQLTAAHLAGIVATVGASHGRDTS